MSTKELVINWFEKWEKGDYLDLPISDTFKHTSPYGKVDGKGSYLSLVDANKDKFLGYRFLLKDLICDGDKACVRYTARQADSNLDVTEWHFVKDDRIEEIVAYYNIEGEISESRKLLQPDGISMK